MINTQVTKQQNENTASMIRRFSRRVQNAGVLKRARANRYYKRPLSKNLQKQKALEILRRRAEFERLEKLGKR